MRMSWCSHSWYCLSSYHLLVQVLMTPAAHSSSLDDEPEINAGVAAGFVLGFSDGLRVYHAGDTAAFSGMALVGEVQRKVPVPVLVTVLPGPRMLPPAP